ncbi:hypothetical protein [Paenibacillus sp. Y412MC10]|uniref:hypothetical protein n=1 Tax=Geobacillus sp. (strain Y412MC10) TaxID=481743 RepID=UPI0011AB8CA6|nr:hypothetical protein [Paenibacillus sp. Y412MC10]
MQGKTIVLMGLDGYGRRQLINDMMKNEILSTRLVEIPSFTTRRQQVGEVEGEEFYFISDEKFERQVTEGLLFSAGTSEDGVSQIASPLFT